MSHWIKAEDGTMIRSSAINALMIEQCDQPLHWFVWGEAPGASSILKTFYEDKGQTLADAEGFREHIAYEISGEIPMITTVCNAGDRKVST